MENFLRIFPSNGKNVSTVWKNHGGGLSRECLHRGGIAFGAGPVQTRGMKAKRAGRWVGVAACLWAAGGAAQEGVSQAVAATDNGTAIERLWPDEAGAYLRSAGDAVRALEGKGDAPGVGEALDRLFWAVLDKRGPDEDLAQAQAYFALKPEFVRTCLGFDEIHYGIPQLIAIAGFLGEVRDRTLPRYEKRATPAPGLYAWMRTVAGSGTAAAAGEAYDTAVREHRRDLAMDELQARLAQSDAAVAVPLLNVCSQLVHVGYLDEESAAAIAFRARLSAEECAGIGMGFLMDRPEFRTRDSDGDGLPDVDETKRHGTDPRLPDTDGDGLPDGWEVQSGLDPLDDGAVDPVNGPGGDADGDGFDNATECKLGSPADNPAWSGEQLCFGLTHARPRRAVPPGAAGKEPVVLTVLGTNSTVRELEVEADSPPDRLVAQAYAKIQSGILGAYIEKLNYEPGEEELKEYCRRTAPTTEEAKTMFGSNTTLSSEFIFESLWQDWQSDATNEHGPMQLAAKSLKDWKLNQSLFAQHGGRVLVEPSRVPQAYDAVRALLAEREEAGDFKIHDADLRERYWAWVRMPPPVPLASEEEGRAALAEHPADRFRREAVKGLAEHLQGKNPPQAEPRPPGRLEETPPP